MKRELAHSIPKLSKPKGGIAQWSNEPQNDSNAYVALIPLFFVCAFVIYFLIEITLIPLLTASRWLVLFGSVSFLGLFALRKRLKFDLADGMILSIFGIAPLLMAGVLTVNYFFSTTYTETHAIANSESRGSVTEIHLENGAYEEFYRIREFYSHELHRTPTITYTFGKGALGWQIVKGTSWD